MVLDKMPAFEEMIVPGREKTRQAGYSFDILLTFYSDFIALFQYEQEEEYEEKNTYINGGYHYIGD